MLLNDKSVVFLFDKADFSRHNAFKTISIDGGLQSNRKLIETIIEKLCVGIDLSEHRLYALLRDNYSDADCFEGEVITVNIAGYAEYYGYFDGKKMHLH